MPPRELIRLEEVIIGSGELEFVGNLEKSRFRTHLKSFAGFIGCVHYSRSQTRKKIQSSYCLPDTLLPLPNLTATL